MTSNASLIMIGVKMPPEAVDRLDIVAKAHGVTRSQFVRSLIGDAVGAEIDAPNPTGPVVNGEELRGIQNELGQQGSLLNQVAKAMNTRGATPAAQASLSAMQASYTETLHTLRQLLGVTRTP